MKLGFSRHMFQKYSTIKLHENLSSGRRVDPCGETGMTKLTAAFRNSEQATKKINLTILTPEFSSAELFKPLPQK